MSLLTISLVLESVVSGSILPELSLVIYPNSPGANSATSLPSFGTSVSSNCPPLPDVPPHPPEEASHPLGPSCWFSAIDLGPLVLPRPLSQLAVSAKPSFVALPIAFTPLPVALAPPQIALPAKLSTVPAPPKRSEPNPLLAIVPYALLLASSLPNNKLSIPLDTLFFNELAALSILLVIPPTILFIPFPTLCTGFIILVSNPGPD